GSKLRFDWAAVLFSTDVISSSPFEKDPARAKDEIERLIQHPAEGGTSTDQGLKKALEFLTTRHDHDGYKASELFVLLISDGAPNDAGAAQAAATGIWDTSSKKWDDPAGVTIITLKVGPDNTEGFMKSISGKANHVPRGDPDWYFDASDPEL